MSTDTEQIPAGWTADQLPSQKGKIAIVTGANAGIGYVQAKELALKGARVICACRNKVKAEKAVEMIQEELKKDSSTSGSVEFMQLDLGSLESVRTFVTEFRKSCDHIDILLNNGGIAWQPYQLSADGYESHFAINHLGHFALTAQVFDLLRKSAGARVVNVSSLIAAHMSKYSDETIVPAEDTYEPYDAYMKSKFCNASFTMELDRRLKAAGITNVMSVVAHPGLTSSNIMNEPRPDLPWYRQVMGSTFNYFMYFAGMTVEQGARSELYAAAGENVQGGDYIGFNGIRQARGDITKMKTPDLAKSEDAGKKLWALSEKMSKMSFPVEK